MEVTQITNSELASWKDFVIKHSEYSIGHLPEWWNLFEEVFGYNCFYLMAREGREVIGILPIVKVRSLIYRANFLISVPFSQYAGLLSDSEEASEMLVKRALEVAKKENVRFLELRQNGVIPCVYSHSAEHCDQFLELPDDPDILWRGFKDKVRNQVRKARKSGLTVEKGIHLLDEFYKVYSHNMRDLAFPVFGRRFFVELAKVFKQRVEILVVKRQGLAIGCMLVFSAGNTLFDYFASTIREYNRFCPNNILYWEAVKMACINGHRYFDFGRSQWGSGIYRFKKQWGTTAVPLYYYYPYRHGCSMPSVTNEARKLKPFMNIWKRLPLCMANSLGPLVRKNIPF